MKEYVLSLLFVMYNKTWYNYGIKEVFYEKEIDINCSSICNDN